MPTAGKTAPKLVNDFLKYDPASRSLGNYLTDSPKPAGEGVQIQPAPSDCQHVYSIKSVQSVLPPVDSRPQAGTQYKVAVTCRKCRIHADVHIVYPPSATTTTPCPSAENPLHHFQFQQDRMFSSREHIRYGWLCTVKGCHAEATISYRRARISDDVLEIFSAERLQRRHEEILQEMPQRDVKTATPMSAMHNLQRYLKDALDPAAEKRRLMANNKLFMATFGIYGRDSVDLLDRLGFVFQRAEDEDDQDRWILPDPPQLHNRLQTDGQSHREVLEDVETEVVGHMCTMAAKSGDINPLAQRGWPSADREVERVLGAQNYPTYNPLRRAPTPTDVLPFFASLGTLPNFADSLIEFAYDRQVECDPELSAYYLECLQVISEHRISEPLQTKLAVLASLSLNSRRDIRQAYRYLDVKQEDSDDYILSKFSVRQSSSGVDAQEEGRQALGRIGMSRSSDRLIRASKQELETYDDALNWLGNGVDKSTEDGMLISVFSIKTEENPEMTRKACEIIAEARNSTMLKEWLTGKPSSAEDTMSATEALRHLNIEMNLKDIDDATLLVIFESARADRPGGQTEKAIAAIQKELSEPSSSSRPPELWPVGLTSHGNTCYLNSLLQYYFSIKPLREIVLDYDKYKLDTNMHSEKAERVGQRIITTVEIKGGQRFADDLKYLFQRMIKDRQSHVKPEEDLVCRAFLEPKDYALLTSEVRGEKHETIKANEETRSVEEVKTNGFNTATEVDAAKHVKGIAEADVQDPQDPPHSDASSATLIGDEDVAMKDNDSPPTPHGSPAQNAIADATVIVDNPEPAQPPPLPPRRFSTTKEAALLKAEQNARQQQDVTEVHDGAMFRLRSGMIAKGMDERGEQQDELRDIFEISLKETAVAENGSEKSKLEANSSITTDVPNESTDIYALLDKVFDLQDIPGTNKTTYKTLETAPPLLQVAIPRIGYNPQRGAFKSEELVLLHNELYLDRYMDNPKVLPKRRKCWGWRKQLRACKEERDSLSNTSEKIDSDGPLALTESARFLNELSDISNDLEDVGVDGIDVEPDLPSDVLTEAQKAQSRITELQSQIDELQAHFNLQFEDMKNVKYDLASVFIHRGGNSSGHYWIYIRDFAKDCWRSYNDETVSELTHAEFREKIDKPTYSNGTPTYAVYVREADRKTFVDPVCRDPEPVPAVLENTWAPAEGRTGDTVTEGGQNTWDTERQVAVPEKW